ncbi:MAG: hypothetical protein ABI833_02825 [Acidobacteriota bacterium]
MSSDARPSVLVHATEEILEEYSFGRISEPQLGRLEEHLLICPECQSALADIDEYRVFMKAGLVSLARERQAVAGPPDSPARPGLLAGPASPTGPAPPIPVRRSAPSLQFALPRIPVTRITWAAALLLVAAGATVAWRMQPSIEIAPAIAPVATVQLVAMRGGEGDMARAPSGRPLDLVFERTDLPQDLSYRAQVVNATGRQISSGNVRIAGQSLSVRVDVLLPAGVYWVRLYSSGGQLLREYGLNIV